MLLSTIMPYNEYHTICVLAFFLWSGGFFFNRRKNFWLFHIFWIYFFFFDWCFLRLFWKDGFLKNEFANSRFQTKSMNETNHDDHHLHLHHHHHHHHHHHDNHLFSAPYPPKIKPIFVTLDYLWIGFYSSHQLFVFTGRVFSGKGRFDSLAKSRVSPKAHSFFIACWIERDLVAKKWD